mmetsp:Transcript_38874/g.103247  ORF Transcript_38874/g.103247 Transcript_38874/m.103247 type:complete len:338 (+) Transcript_38874:1104-2117(+)
MSSCRRRDRRACEAPHALPPQAATMPASRSKYVRHPSTASALTSSLRAPHTELAVKRWNVVSSLLATAVASAVEDALAWRSFPDFAADSRCLPTVTALTFDIHTPSRWIADASGGQRPSFESQRPPIKLRVSSAYFPRVQALVRYCLRRVRESSPRGNSKGGANPSHLSGMLRPLVTSRCASNRPTPSRTSFSSPSLSCRVVSWLGASCNSLMRNPPEPDRTGSATRPRRDEARNDTPRAHRRGAAENQACTSASSMRGSSARVLHILVFSRSAAGEPSTSMWRGGAAPVQSTVGASSGATSTSEPGVTASEARFNNSSTFDRPSSGEKTLKDVFCA